VLQQLKGDVLIKPLVLLLLLLLLLRAHNSTPPRSPRRSMLLRVHQPWVHPCCSS
jgi:hypothetical protein